MYICEVNIKYFLFMVDRQHCGKEFEGDIESYYCCNGYMCGCYGQPTEPIVCGLWCYCNVYYKRAGKKEIIKQYFKILWLNFKRRW